MWFGSARNRKPRSIARNTGKAVAGPGGFANSGIIGVPTDVTVDEIMDLVEDHRDDSVSDREAREISREIRSRLRKAGLAES